MPKRQIKKTTITYQQPLAHNQSKQSQRSRDKKPKIQVVDANSRKAKLAIIRNQPHHQQQQTIVKIENNAIQPYINVTPNLNNSSKPQQQHHEKVKLENALVKTTQNSQHPIQQQKQQEIQQENSQNQQDNDQKKVMLKPVYIAKQDRPEEHANQVDKEQQRKKKALRYTTKLLLLQNAKNDAISDEQLIQSSDEQLQTDLPNDDDQNNQQYEYQLWKIRQLKRIRRDREERRKLDKQKVQIERRRKMNNEQILLQNKVMGSDATDHTSQTKYVYMQKYYHKGAFYQDSEDAIFKRDYNLPTPLQMQDKSMLPQILQRRQGNFGKKGQSKYKHLTAEDTTNFDPQYRADQGILASWKKKTAGYKGAQKPNI